MKTFAVLTVLLSVAAALNPLAQRQAQCACDVSKCPPAGTEKHCQCVVSLTDNCYVEQTNAGVDCGLPTYPTGIPEQACGGSTNQTCGAGDMCYFPDKSCDPQTTACTGLCASDFCGGNFDKPCPDARWSCVLEDACVRAGNTDCDGKCELN
ncbi:hypothetical protein BU24DRAFT_384722 [Aaosphaeria arxii CBS 175.79]|uniref:Extracellular membrane protein CFEM domain-containing protein n=1 Tax=Aaosphaeria arxii CBS 175.79 TaxID=1450172 RepID=A0A6A5YAE7_9PLEO|nr:uncharacterized protein BU24DRAFT_384722 [Aaosphaeria arxii CBS 175.79]KAF2022193.1 hypothetical protein BU24DRAFT_384722 [Aaosphaeria arxii CBS 175.79]